MVSSNNSTAQLSRSDNSSLEIGLDICTCQDFTCNVYITNFMWGRPSMPSDVPPGQAKKTTRDLTMGA